MFEFKFLVHDHLCPFSHVFESIKFEVISYSVLVKSSLIKFVCLFILFYFVIFGSFSFMAKLVQSFTKSTTH